MVKSETRKTMLKKVEEFVGADAYAKDHVILDTLSENHNRHHIAFGPSLQTKTPLTMSLIDGSVKLVQYISSNSLPSQKGVDITEFFKSQEELAKPRGTDGDKEIDVMDDVWMWTEGDPNVKSISMDSLRERMGLSSENAHDALQDVKDTANIWIKLQKSRRAVYRNMKFEKAFADGKLFV